MDVGALGHQAPAFVPVRPASISVGEHLEQVPAVVGAGTGLGVVLHAERRHAEDTHPFVGEVVEVEVRDLDLAVEAGRVDAEVVVLTGDLDVAGGLVAHRMVAPVVTEGQLERLAAQRPAEQLVSEADAEHGHLAEQCTDRVDRVPDHGGVAGAVAEEDPVRTTGHDVGSAGRRGHDIDGSECRQVTQHGGLDPEVEGDDPPRPVAHDVGLVGGHVGDQVDAVGTPLCGRRGAQL